MNVLDSLAIRLPCYSCGKHYQVPLHDVLLSHGMIHRGCPVPQETECPPVFQSRLFGAKEIKELQRAWTALEKQARGDGGELVFMDARMSQESTTVLTSVQQPANQKGACCPVMTPVADSEG